MGYRWVRYEWLRITSRECSKKARRVTQHDELPTSKLKKSYWTPGVLRVD